MMIPRTARATILLTVLLLAAPSAQSPADRWWAHVSFLASDALEGRETGSPGHRKAAEYIAAAFEKAGLKPAGTKGFYQSVPFRSQRVIEERSSLTLVHKDREEPLVLGREAYFNQRVKGAPKLEAPLVFAGYGLTVPEAQHDDFAGLDARGKVVVIIGGGPANIPGPLLAHYQNAAVRGAYLQKAGAIGLITIRSPIGQDIPWDRAALSRSRAGLTIADASMDDNAGQQLSVTWNTDLAASLFTGTGRDVKELIAIAAARKPLPTFALPGRIRSTLALEEKPFDSDNVLGLLPGTDPSVANEFVVFSAHLDHLGVGEPINGDRINNGAMDNASGIATLIESAAQLAAAGKRFRRPVIFAAVTGEEHGLLGSRYYALKPALPAGGRIVANVNTDMALPLFPLKSVIAQGLEESNLADDLRKAGAEAKIDVLSDPEPERNAFVRSDQYSFIREGVPSLSLKVGFVKDSPEHAIVRKWRAERYHAPSDDLQQPVDLQAAVDYANFVLKLASAIADRPSAPQWLENSFFKRFAKSR